MDAKITKKRLSYLLSYDWVKIVLTVVAAIVVWSLVFTMTATRVTNTQRFVVVNYQGVYYGSKGAGPLDRFSHEVIEAEALDNMRGGDEMFGQIFMANMEVGDGDIMLAADYPTSREAQKDESGNDLLDTEGNVVYNYGQTYMERLLMGYASSFTRLDDNGVYPGYFTQMKNYLMQFYAVESEAEKTFGQTVLKVATFDENSLNEGLVKEEFRARIKANKDKRYKKEAQIVAAESKELERIRSYLDAYNTFFTYLEEGRVTLTYVSIELEEDYTFEGVYGINLCPDEEKMGGLKEYFYYTDFDKTATAKGMNAMFMNLEGLDLNYQYENLLYLNALIEEVYKA